MARMFSTEFDYKKETYTATVVISGLDGEKTIGIKVPETLQHIIPWGKIVVEAETGLPKAEECKPKDPLIIKNILAAVAHHEEDHPPVNLWS